MMAVFRKQILRYGFLAIGLFMAWPSQSLAEQLTAQFHQVGSAGEYLISGILRRSDDAAQVKLVQGVQLAGSRADAIAGFSREALAQYPGYTLIDALATPIPARPCGTAI